jgi:hypothetical protein
MSIEKKFLKSKPFCKVKFSLAGEPYNTAKSISAAGEFNDWDLQATPLKKSKNGIWTATIDLEPGREYQFRYCIDGNVWVNDPEPDKSVPSGLGDTVNSVIVL